MVFRWSFFDVVFELVRVERYEKILNPKSPPNQVEKIKENFQNKFKLNLKTDQAI